MMKKLTNGSSSMQLIPITSTKFPTLFTLLIEMNTLPYLLNTSILTITPLLLEKTLGTTLSQVS
jgi:hypothetical protein